MYVIVPGLSVVGWACWSVWQPHGKEGKEFFPLFSFRPSQRRFSERTWAAAFLGFAFFTLHSPFSLVMPKAKTGLLHCVGACKFVRLLDAAWSVYRGSMEQGPGGSVRSRRGEVGGTSRKNRADPLPGPTLPTSGFLAFRLGFVVTFITCVHCHPMSFSMPFIPSTTYSLSYAVLLSSHSVPLSSSITHSEPHSDPLLLLQLLLSSSTTHSELPSITQSELLVLLLVLLLLLSSSLSHPETHF